MQQGLYIGVMSGTSLDGIDIALVDISANNITLIASHCYPIPDHIGSDLLTICEQKQCSLQTLGQIDHQLGKLYAESINHFIKTNRINRNEVIAIGCHGQTIFHSPNGDSPFTMQIGDANIVAAKTGITTIADFRRKDMAFGGQGAPLVPAFHQALFSVADKNRIILNIGGISNITCLCPNQAIIGYDTGPGNVLLDSWIMMHLNEPYDKDAHWAKTGQVNKPLLNELLSEPYFQLTYPKSTGRELFNLRWLQYKLSNYSLPAADVQATLVDLTVMATVNQLNNLLANNTLPCELFVCGGGAKNSLIMARFNELLPNWLVATTDTVGINSDYMEAMAFAWLAYCRINNLASNIPSVTGATQSVSLGVIYPK
ncbi:anhydro-N-acetylmuramic acid kinase [Orbus hercynius]|uniref:Anhydro-N-acetylmuramic acid kinase n=1 Tax=Orbus hercynius TaxID=593135 RepID=A0A495REC1_9GAMM|nr:anhydro-N-acetylmuramic acid kinase [Orbus hercynius]RKS85837.1 anhydro-N-acetylmuramic acid kinase [Orbus hercynius]